MAPLQLKQAGMQFVQPLNEGLLRGPDGIPNLDGHVFWQNLRGTVGTFSS